MTGGWTKIVGGEGGGSVPGGDLNGIGVLVGVVVNSGTPGPVLVRVCVGVGDFLGGLEVRVAVGVSEGEISVFVEVGVIEGGTSVLVEVGVREAGTSVLVDVGVAVSVGGSLDRVGDAV
jgi:hypothetical protein